VASPYETQLTLTPPRVLGRRLCAFTLGHAHLLEIAKSPFMGCGGGVDAADLILAVWICTFNDYTAARAAAVAALDGKIPRSVRRWGKRISLNFDLEAETTKLATYIVACTKSPRMTKAKESKALATPAAATLSVLHRHYFGTSAAAAFNVPFLDALLDVITYHHAKGWADLLSDSQADFIDQIVALRKQAESKETA